MKNLGQGHILLRGVKNLGQGHILLRGVKNLGHILLRGVKNLGKRLETENKKLNEENVFLPESSKYCKYLESVPKEKAL